MKKLKLLTEHLVCTDKFGGKVDLITGIDDFEVPVEFIEDTHMYLGDDVVPLPSVTQLLDDGEYKYVDSSKLKYAQDKGTIVHQEIEEWLNDGKIGITPEIDEFIRIFNENKNKFYEKAVWDWKTYNTNSKHNREKCWKQLSMYCEAIEYLTGEKIKKKYMVWLPQNKEGKLIDLSEEFEKE